MEAVDLVRKMVAKSGVVIPKGSKLWLSHHYGFSEFARIGAAIYECFNETQYAKKILVMLSKQHHPMHYHKRKAEAFVVLYGALYVTRIPAWSDKEEFHRLGVGEWLALQVADRHEFYSPFGCVFEEISGRHYEMDSFYDDDSINRRNEDRKTFIP